MRSLAAAPMTISTSLYSIHLSGSSSPTFTTAPSKRPRAGDVAFVQAALSKLRPGGRAAIVVSTGFLGAAFAEDARRALLENYSVDAVLALQDEHACSESGHPLREPPASAG